VVPNIKIYKHSRRSSCGAVLAESALFFSVFCVIFFAIFDLAQAFREVQVLTEAARHGARSLGSRTTIEGRCPADLGVGGAARKCGIDEPPSGEVPLAETALMSACDFIREAGLEEKMFEVGIFGFTEGDPGEGTAYEKAELLKNNKTGDPVSYAFFFTVRARRIEGRPCTICVLKNLAELERSVTFPLNPNPFTRANPFGFGQCPPS
jgi:hypothetical protein